MYTLPGLTDPFGPPPTSSVSVADSGLRCRGFEAGQTHAVVRRLSAHKQLLDLTARRGRPTLQEESVSRRAAHAFRLDTGNRRFLEDCWRLTSVTCVTAFRDIGFLSRRIQLPFVIGSGGRQPDIHCGEDVSGGWTRLLPRLHPIECLSYRIQRSLLEARPALLLVCIRTLAHGENRMFGLKVVKMIAWKNRSCGRKSEMSPGWLRKLSAVPQLSLFCSFSRCANIR